MLSCTLCPLSEGRTQAVPGEGPVPADLVFIGEGPGEVEDATGRPFVGPAGQLLDKILESAGLKREEAYITNMVKCRPPLNRTPKPEEVKTCWPYLDAQLRLLRPKIIVPLGNLAAQFFLKTDKGINLIRGQFFKWEGTVELFPMFHPSYLLRNPTKEKGGPKYLTWQDIQTLKGRLDELRASSRG
ncbi:MAG: uracil-DNA glycosylase [Candidatus Acetothermia bacterium]|nr:uracil-DNA glycosylase [Candidatus Acetothermia bacterium]MDH7504860.1 uracil-DNA glycosylase [Candidatus Acetothermia bacterium]